VKGLSPATDGFMWHCEADKSSCRLAGTISAVISQPTTEL